MTAEHPGASPSVSARPKRISPWLFVGLITLVALVALLLVFFVLD
jgi:hypothetical protein